jgi:transglutaminase-like putative cysteine protease
MALFASTTWATVFEVGGHQAGSFQFHMEFKFKTTGTYTQTRVTLPTAYNLLYGSNLFYANGYTIEVTDDTGQPLVFHDIPYWPGTLSSGEWIQVINPSPGELLTYVIKVDVFAFNTLSAYGLAGDVERFTPDGPAYTFPTPGCDSDSPVIASALDQALASWPSGTLSGVRGDLERIALLVNGLTYASPNVKLLNDRTASQVLMSRSGDCDDLVKVQCALQRRYGVPSRVVLCGVIESPDLGVGGNEASCLHAFGEYWSGEHWESYEATGLAAGTLADIENFETANNVVLGISDDFSNLRPQVADYPYGYPADYDGQTYSGSPTNGGSGGFVERGERDIGPIGGAVFCQSVDLSHVLNPQDPYDVVATAGSGTDVPLTSPTRLGSLRIRPERQPSVGFVKVAVSVPSTGRLELGLFDVLGRRLASSTANVEAATDLPASFSMTGRRSGVYFVHAELGELRGIAKVVYLAQ